MIRCPLCRARYRGGTSCRRCRVDLRTVSDLEQNAGRQAHHAVQQILAGNMDRADHHARRAKKQHATRFHTLLCGFVTGLRDGKNE